LFVTCPQFYILHEVPFDYWRPTPYALRFHGERSGLTCAYVEQAGTAWDILGTILGANLNAAKAQPRSLINRSCAFVIDRITSAVFRLLKTRWLQSRVTWGTTRFELYLSNVALFSKLDG
jgi:hypothetical protein